MAKFGFFDALPPYIFGFFKFLFLSQQRLIIYLSDIRSNGGGGVDGFLVEIIGFSEILLQNSIGGSVGNSGSLMMDCLRFVIRSNFSLL